MGPMGRIGHMGPISRFGPPNTFPNNLTTYWSARISTSNGSMISVPSTIEPVSTL